MASEIAAAVDENVHEEVDSIDVEQSVIEQYRTHPQNQEEELPAIEPRRIPLEAELRQVISLLVAGGQEMGDIMEYLNLSKSVNEHLLRAGCWGMFVRLSDGSEPESDRLLGPATGVCSHVFAPRALSNRMTLVKFCCFCGERLPGPALMQQLRMRQPTSKPRKQVKSPKRSRQIWQH